MGNELNQILNIIFLVPVLDAFLSGIQIHHICLNKDLNPHRLCLDPDPFSRVSGSGSEYFL